MRASDGTLIDYSLGEDASGLLIYIADGYMSAQLMRMGRPLYDHPWSAGGPAPSAAASATA